MLTHSSCRASNISTYAWVDENTWYFYKSCLGWFDIQFSSRRESKWTCHDTWFIFNKSSKQQILSKQWCGITFLYILNSAQFDSDCIQVCSSFLLLKQRSSFHVWHNKFVLNCISSRYPNAIRIDFRLHTAFDYHAFSYSAGYFGNSLPGDIKN